MKTRSRESLNWQDDSACRSEDPELFFHPSNERGSRKSRRIEAAKAVCAQCDVRQQCLDYALRNKEEFGTWGGQSEDERRAMLGQIALSAERQTA